MSSLPSSSTLTLRLLGPLEIELDGQPLTSQLLAKAQGLLAYLALTQQQQPRTSLMVLLWGDSSEEAARMSLRGVLANLRARLEPFLLIERQTVALRPETKMWVDAVAFEQQLTQALAQQDVNGLEEALALYRGELLSGFTVRKAPDFERWLYGEQERLRLLVIRGLEALATSKASAGKVEDAVVHLRRVLALEPWREETHRQLMKLLVRVGQRSAALAQYASCVQALDEELGVEPSPETKTLYEEIQQNTLTVEEFEQQKSYAEPRLTAEPSATLVGRQVEWQRLLQVWQQASQGQAQVAVIAGEAGIGKTRLAEELAAWVRQQGGRVAIAHCYAAEGAMAFTPVIELLRSEPVLRTLTELDDVWLAEVARLLPELITQHPQLRVTEPSGDPLQRQRFFEALALAVLGSQRALLLVIDDLQWADRETLEWLRYLLRFAPQARLLLVGTMRSEEVMEEHPLQLLLVTLRRAQQLVEIQLEGLSTAQTGTLATQLSGQEIPVEKAIALYQQTEGNPLFVVETVRAQLDSSREGASHRAPHGSAVVPLPEGIKAVIQARLAQLSPLAQEVAQLAAAVGRDFSLELLAQVGNYPEEELIQSLDELWRRHIFQDLSGGGYDFSHARIRDVAYSHISPIRRRLLHRRIAEAVVIVFADKLDAVSGQVAMHFELSNDITQAIVYHQRAGRFAKQAFALRETVVSLQKALTLLLTLPDSEERSRQELDIQLELGPAFANVVGASRQESQDIYNRALELAQSGDTDSNRYAALWGLHTSYLLRAEYTKSLEAGQLCWEIAVRSGDPELLIQAHHALAHSTFYTAKDLQRSVDHAKQVITLYQPEWHLQHVMRYGGHDPCVCTSSALARAQWLLGYPDQAIESSQAAISLATKLGHPFSMIIALTSAAKVSWYRREPLGILKLLEQVQPLLVGGQKSSDEMTLRGWAIGQLHEAAEAVTPILNTMANWQEKGRRMEQPALHALLAETYAQLGNLDSARQAIEEGLAVADVTHEEYYLSELYRLQGCFLLSAGEARAAQASLEKALAIARTQGSKSLELRAATDLSQLWASQGRRSEGFELLASIYNWFTEGFTTGDLCQARGVLSDLST